MTSKNDLPHLNKITIMEPEGLIFDCDGTLVDTMPIHFKAWSITTEKYGLIFPEDRFYALGGVSPFEPRYNDDALSIGVGKSFELRGSSSGSSLPYTFDSGTAGLGRRYDSTSVRLSSADTAGFLTSFFDMGSCETFSGGTSDMSFVGSPPGSASAPQSPPIAHSSTTSGPSASIRSSSTLSGVGTNVWSPAAIAAAAAADLLTQRRHPLSGEILESRSSSSGSGEADHRNILSSGNSNMNFGLLSGDCHHLTSSPYDRSYITIFNFLSSNYFI